MSTIISIVGNSDSGKTTLLESIITDLKGRGYRVGVIKHSAEDVEFDTVNKDSWKFTRAGSAVSAISSSSRLAVFKNLEHDPEPTELARLVCPDCDLVLTEGFKQGHNFKIEVHRREQGGGLLSPAGQLLAVVTDEALNTDVPQFTRDETEKIADLIEQMVLARPPEDDVDLLVNDIPVPLKPPVRNLLSRSLVALVSGIRGFKEITSLRISLRRKP
ncbi:MAG: molybdopterin-guanine dinucleotide biosynthesis protein B [Dehalococcoidales bacterium]